MFHFFVKEEQIGQETIVMTGPDVNHMKNVLRMKEGEKIQVSNGNDRDYLCQVEEIGKDQILVRILEEREDSPELGTKLYLFQGLPKADKMELIIQKAVELGVWEIIPVSTKRTVVKLDPKKEESKGKRWNAIAESAAKQSGRRIIPMVKPVMTLKEAFSYSRSLDKNLIPYEHARNMAETRETVKTIQTGMQVGIFIGPEGGFEEEEIRQAMEEGILPITLGRRILRTETAGLAILSVLMFALEDSM